MKSGNGFYQKQLEAIHNFYNELKKKQNELSITDVIVAWFAEGYAERFRDEYLKKHSVLS